MARSLQTPREHYARQATITASTVVAARRARKAGDEPRVLATIVAGQLASVRESQRATPAILREQGISAPPVGRLVESAYAGWTAAGQLLTTAVRRLRNEPEFAFDRFVATEVQDAGRVSSGVDTVVRPNVGGHVRYLRLPSCSRCVILGGRWYRWSDGFERHPLCDCVMLPTNEDPARDLVTDPMAAFRSGKVHGLSQADVKAVNDGADLAQVVNVRSKRAGLKVAGRVYDRAGRPTPEAIYALASDRDDAIRLLGEHGYIR